MPLVGEERERLFGTDLFLRAQVGGMDLSNSYRGDIATAFGNDNIVQALTLRLMVRQGELERLGLPDYGSRIHELIGERNIPRTHQKLMAFARAAIEADPRVAEVTEVRAVATEQTTVRLTLDIRLIDEPNPLNLVYEVSLDAQQRRQGLGIEA
jgi:phage baseplate assembly protein W